MNIKWTVRLLRLFIFLFALVLIVPALGMIVTFIKSDFSKRDSANIAPDPMLHKEAVLHVYGADAYGWRGLFAIHTWFAVKKVNAENYTVYQVIGWRMNRGLPALSIEQGVADRYWFGSQPKLLLQYSGEVASRLIEKLDNAAKNYPFANEYTLWPGPNSNSFSEWVALEVPELELDLPASAIGKNWMKENYHQQ